MTAHSGDDTYYEVCIALDSSDSSVAEQLSDIFVSAIMDFSGEAVEIQGAKIIIRTSKDRQFIDALLAHIGDLSANLSEIWKTQITTAHTIEIKQNRDWIEEYKKGIKPLQCGRFYIYPPWEKPLVENSSLGAPFALGENFGEQQTPSLVLSPKFSPNTKSPPQILELDFNSNATESSLRGRIADSHEAIQKNQSCDSTNRISPDSWCKKSESKGAVVPPADFLLESDKRGSPPKSEKRQLLARRGSGAGGAALLRKEKSESNSKKIVGDSQVAKIDCHDSANPESRNDGNIKNANSSIVSEKSGLCSHERGNKTKASIDEASGKLHDLSPQDEFATDFATINILLEPSLAFGTGHHASTFMCIEAIQALHAQDSLKNKKLLDFGCGSGILALCAEKLGAVVDLCDIDESAIIESKKNFNNNNAKISHIWQGGIADRVAKKGAKSGIYDIIVANIIASVLIEQKDNIALSLKRGGIVVLSGILDIYKDEVLARFSDFTPLAIRQSDEWICAILQYRKNIA